MKKLVGLFVLCVFGIVPGASAQFAGGDGDGYDSGSTSLRVTRYVATTGSDAGNDCTDALNPCATIGHAVDQANAGDTLDLGTGSYTEPGLVIDKALNIQGAGVIVQ